jgi:hypothetical protein
VLRDDNSSLPSFDASSLGAPLDASASASALRLASFDASSLGAPLDVLVSVSSLRDDNSSLASSDAASFRAFYEFNLSNSIEYAFNLSKSSFIGSSACVSDICISDSPGFSDVSSFRVSDISLSSPIDGIDSLYSNSTAFSDDHLTQEGLRTREELRPREETQEGLLAQEELHKEFTLTAINFKAQEGLRSANTVEEEAWDKPAKISSACLSSSVHRGQDQFTVQSGLELRCDDSMQATWHYGGFVQIYGDFALSALDILKAPWQNGTLVSLSSLHFIMNSLMIAAWLIIDYKFMYRLAYKSMSNIGDTVFGSQFPNLVSSTLVANVVRRKVLANCFSGIRRCERSVNFWFSNGIS